MPSTTTSSVKLTYAKSITYIQNLGNKKLYVFLIVVKTTFIELADLSGRMTLIWLHWILTREIGIFDLIDVNDEFQQLF